MDIDKILKNTIEITKDIGLYVKNEQKVVKKDNIETKRLNDFVTYVDKTAEKKLVEKFKKILPEAGFITEEQTETKRGTTYNWIIDPLDGTTNYIHGLLPVAVSVALQKDDETILGVVYEIGLDECFYAVKGKGAFLNGKKITVSTAPKIYESLIATGFPYSDYTKLPPFMETLDFFMKNSHGLRRFGSAATDLAYVASGRVEAFYEYNLNAWDVAAGALLVQEAGGKVCNFSGNDNYIFGKEIIATNANIFVEVLQTIKNIMC